METIKLRRRIKASLIILIFGLALSGISALPIETELQSLNEWLQSSSWQNPLTRWIALASHAVVETNARFPFLAYGTDWLAFAHLVIAILFIGPMREPVKNRWVVEFGIIASVAILPWAFITGEVRSIPVFWRLLDCMFGIAGGALLMVCYFDIKKLERMKYGTSDP